MEASTNDGTPVASAPLSAEQFRKDMELLMERIQDRERNLTPRVTESSRESFSRMEMLKQFFSSGVFFIALGLILLGAAYIALDRGVHTSFSFVLVVLGVAVLLFGTGTQGIGKLDTNTATAQYNVAIAGGAGVLAIAIGFGMIKLGPEMQRAFDLETRYVAAELQPHLDSNSSFAGYWGEFELDGQPIASVHRGALFLVYVPYVQTQRTAVKHIRYKLLPVDANRLDPNLKPKVEDIFDLPLRDVDLNNSASDIPIYDKIPAIDMRNTTALNEVLQAGGSQNLPIASGAVPPDPAPPAVLGGH